MDRNVKLIVLFAGGAVAVAVIIYFVFFFGKGATQSAPKNTPTNQAQSNNLPSSGTNVNVDPAAAITPPPVKATEETKAQFTVKNLAQTFAERIGSYSNQNNLTNLVDVQPLVTSKVYSYIQKDYRAALAKTLPSATSYFGVTAKVVSTDIQELSSDSAKLVLHLQRTESGTSSKVTNADMAVTLTKDSDAWLVSYFK